MEADAGEDAGESVGLMEPLLVGEGSPHRGALNDLAVELAARSSGFRRSLPPGVVVALADLVKSMNCYYSNLIEGHDTHPVDIERALKGDYSSDRRSRNLQREALAHIEVQRWIDGGALAGRAATVEGIREIHARFCANLPDDLLHVQASDDGDERLPVAPGTFRTRHVKVGTHVAISPGATQRFMRRFEDAYRRLGRTDAIVATAAAHHRLLWIHPFLDGDGRVARLMSHAMLLDAVGTGGLWSVARGLARNVAAYKSGLAACDLPRRNDLDGRGHLSEEALAGFSRFFLETCIDQVAFMEGLVAPDTLRGRILRWAEEEIGRGELPPRSGALLEAVLYRGELARGDAAISLATGERQARRITSALLKRGVLVSAGSKAPLRLAFPAALAERWTPGLFPARGAADPGSRDQA